MFLIPQCLSVGKNLHRWYLLKTQHRDIFFVFVFVSALFWMLRGTSWRVLVRCRLGQQGCLPSGCSSLLENTVLTGENLVYDKANDVPLDWSCEDFLRTY